MKKKFVHTTAIVNGVWGIPAQGETYALLNRGVRGDDVFITHMTSTPRGSYTTRTLFMGGEKTVEREFIAR